MQANSEKTDKNPAGLPPTKEFVVIGGNDADLWGDIDSPADKAWRDKVWADMQAKKTAKKPNSQ